MRQDLPDPLFVPSRREIALGHWTTSSSFSFAGGLQNQIVHPPVQAEAPPQQRIESGADLRKETGAFGLDEDGRYADDSQPQPARESPGIYVVENDPGVLELEPQAQDLAFAGTELRGR